MNEGNKFGHKHGHTKKVNGKVVTYSSWSCMITRCRGKQVNCRHYENGVRVCPQWEPREGGSFAQFLADMGERPGPEYVLSRYNSRDGHDAGNYEPGNCVWITNSENVKAARAKKAA